VTPLLYVLDGAVVSFTGRTGIDLSAYLPASGKARFVLTYLDLGTNEVGLVAGDETVDSAAVTPTPPFVPANSIPTALVRLAGGMADVTEADIWDLRLILNEVPAVDGGGGGGDDEDGDIPCCGA
jgi:hypothetical protein